MGEVGDAVKEEDTVECVEAPSQETADFENEAKD